MSTWSPRDGGRRGSRRSVGVVRLLLMGLCLVGVCLLTGCGSTQDAEVSLTVQRFSSSLADHDGRTACGLLSPAARTGLEQSSGEACSAAILAEHLVRAADVDSTQVYGTMAIVHTDADTMFLSRFPTGWLVTGVGCTPTHHLDQYDCSVSGG